MKMKVQLIKIKKRYRYNNNNNNIIINNNSSNSNNISNKVSNNNIINNNSYNNNNYNNNNAPNQFQIRIIIKIYHLIKTMQLQISESIHGTSIIQKIQIKHKAIKR